MVAFLSEPDERLLEPAGHAHSAVVVLAQDTLWDMEDLLLRVAACCAVAVESAGDCHTIRLICFRSRVSGALETLRWGVLNIDRYRWRSGGQAGAFVHLMDYQGDDLLLRLTPMRHIRTWADGALVWQVLALLERLRALAGRPVVVRKVVRATGSGPRSRSTVTARRGAP